MVASVTEEKYSRHAFMVLIEAQINTERKCKKIRASAVCLSANCNINICFPQCILISNGRQSYRDTEL